MSEKNKTDQYVEHINSHILPFIDYSELQASYDTDMVYAKGILNRLHEAMVTVYGGELLDEQDGDEGIVVIPGLVRGRDSGKLCLALLDLDLSSSGEHWGTAFLCKSGVISQNEAFSNNAGASAMREAIKAYAPYDYCYTAVIPDDIHVDTMRLPVELVAVLNDFRNHKAVLQFEEGPVQGGESVDTDAIKGVTEVRITAQEFESKMRELLPGASEKAVRQLIDYAEELDERGTHPKGAFFSENYVAYNLAAQQYGIEVAGKVLKICEESCFNHWEILDAARLVSENAPPAEIIKKAVDGELDLDGKQWDEIKAGLMALKNGTLDVPAADEKPSVPNRIRAAAKEPKEATPQQELFKWLDASLEYNLNHYRSMMPDLSVSDEEFIETARKIVAHYDAHAYMKDGYEYRDGDIDALMKLPNPLDAVADGWPVGTASVVVMDAVVHDVVDGETERENRAIQGAAAAMNSGRKEAARDTGDEKPSVIDRIRDAAKAPREPRKDKPKRDKSEPEH